MEKKCVCVFHVKMGTLIPLISRGKKGEKMSAAIKYFEMNMACMKAVIS